MSNTEFSDTQNQLGILHMPNICLPKNPKTKQKSNVHHRLFGLEKGLTGFTSTAHEEHWKQRKFSKENKLGSLQCSPPPPQQGGKNKTKQTAHPHKKHSFIQDSNLSCCFWWPKIPMPPKRCKQPVQAGLWGTKHFNKVQHQVSHFSYQQFNYKKLEGTVKIQDKS